MKEYDEKKSVFKKTSSIAQTLATRCDKSVSEHRIFQLQELKKRLVKCRQDAINQHKLLESALPASESLNTATSELSSWLDRAENMMASHRVDGDIDSVEHRLRSHNVSLYH